MDNIFFSIVYSIIHFIIIFISFIILLLVNDLRINICLLILVILVRVSFIYFNNCILRKLEYNLHLPSVTELGNSSVFLEKVPLYVTELAVINSAMYLISVKVIFIMFVNYYKLDPTKILYSVSNYLP